LEQPEVNDQKIVRPLEREGLRDFVCLCEKGLTLDGSASYVARSGEQPCLRVTPFAANSFPDT